MSQIEKLIEKMRNQPNGIRPEEADRVLNAFGYRLDRQRCSHMHYINKFGDVLTIPNKNPIRAVYVKDILSRIEDRGEDNEN